VDLVEDADTHKIYAVKKIICHGEEDQKVAMKEVEYHGLLKHPNIIECFDSALKDGPNPFLNSTSEVVLVLPYYKVNFYVLELLSVWCVSLLLTVILSKSMDLL
jgi:serine/threonine kinase 16